MPERSVGDILDRYSETSLTYQWVKRADGRTYHKRKKDLKRLWASMKGGNDVPISYKTKAVSTPPDWTDTKELELRIEKMMRALAFKLKRDGMFLPKHVDVANIVYSYLKEGKGRDLRFAEGDLTLLDEFIDSEWPRLVEASKSKPPEPDGFTELPKPVTYESMLGYRQNLVNTTTVAYAGLDRSPYISFSWPSR